MPDLGWATAFIGACLLRQQPTVDWTTAAAWRSKPAWYAISRQDRTISPGLQRFMAERMQAITVEIDAGHLSLITHPQEVTQLILNAVHAVQQRAATGAAPQLI